MSTIFWFIENNVVSHVLFAAFKTYRVVVCLFLKMKRLFSTIAIELFWNKSEFKDFFNHWNFRTYSMFGNQLNWVFTLDTYFKSPNEKYSII